jgi:hypothetical protein
MSILIAIGIGLIGTVVGFGIGLLLGLVAASVFHVSNFEGASSYFAFSIGLIFGVLGLIVSIVLALRWRGVSTFGGILAGGGGAILGIAGLVAAGFAIYYYSQPQLMNRNGVTPYIRFEIMMPKDAPAPEPAALSASLNTSENVMPADWEEKQPAAVDGRPVVAGHVDMYYRTSGRLLSLKLPNNETQLFQLRLPANPSSDKYAKWSDWSDADFLDRGEASSQPEKINPDAIKSGKGYRIRYYVDRRY